MKAIKTKVLKRLRSSPLSTSTKSTTVIKWNRSIRANAFWNFGKFLSDPLIKLIKR